MRKLLIRHMASGAILVAGTFAEAEVHARPQVCQPQWRTGYQLPGVDGEVFSILPVMPDVLYVGGSFTAAQDVLAAGIVRWDGANWIPLGPGVTGVNYPGEVRTMIMFDDGQGAGPQLYVGGSFDHAGDVAAMNVARWDGQQWHALGAGFDGSVRTFAIWDDG